MGISKQPAGAPLAFNYLVHCVLWAAYQGISEGRDTPVGWRSASSAMLQLTKAVACLYEEGRLLETCSMSCDVDDQRGLLSILTGHETRQAAATLVWCGLECDEIRACSL